MVYKQGFSLLFCLEYFQSADLNDILSPFVDFRSNCFWQANFSGFQAANNISRVTLHWGKLRDPDLRDGVGFPKMKVPVFLPLVVLLGSNPVQGLKKCAKINSCRCSTDEGEINLWSLAGKSEDDRPR